MAKGGHVWQRGACMVKGGMHGKIGGVHGKIGGACTTGGCMMGACIVGVCLAGEMATAADGTHPT